MTRAPAPNSRPIANPKKALPMPYDRTSARVELLDMLSFGRPHGSTIERHFVREFIEPLGVTIDKAGNCIKRIGTTGVLWSCHTDTVHKRAGWQQLQEIKGIVSLAPGETASCLGADDTLGVWLMVEMIRANVPGLYIFHAGEEVGGVGSGYIANHTPKLLNGIDCAIALDRKGYGSVITHQGSRSCSSTFARSLANQLGGSFAPDDTGLFTDTTNYVDLIGECTNLSVGYDKAHSPGEYADIGFVMSLRDKLVSLDASKLILLRQPGEPDEDEAIVQFSPAWRVPGDDDEDAVDSWDLVTLCREFPEMAADLLEQCGVSASEFRDTLAAPFAK